MNRRALLTASASSASVALAGCLNQIFRVADVPLGFIEIVNPTHEEVAVTITVEHEGEVLIDEEPTIPAYDEDTYEPGVDRIYHEDFGSYDNFEISAATRDGSFETSASSANVSEELIADTDASCFYFAVIIGSLGTHEYNGLGISRWPIRDFVADGDDALPEGCRT